MKKHIFLIVLLFIYGVSIGVYAKNYLVQLGSATPGSTTWTKSLGASDSLVDLTVAGKSLDAWLNSRSTWQAGSQVWIIKGTYQLGATISVSSGLSIYGGFAGTESAISARTMNASNHWDFGTNITILDGSVSGVKTVNGFKTLSTATSVIIDGFTIQNCTNSSNTTGAAAVVYGTGSCVQNCIIASCTSTGIAGSGASAGISLGKGATLKDSYLHDNISTSTGTSAGGVTVMDNSVVSGCKIENNKSLDGGGAFLYTPTVMVNGPTIQNCTLVGNQSTGAANGGGGISTYLKMASTNPTLISNCIFTANSVLIGTTKGGGALRVVGPGIAQVSNCSFTANTALNGSAAYLENPTTFYNCLMAGNVGAVLYVPTAGSVFNNLTVASNLTSAGLPVGAYVKANATFTNCLFFNSGATPINVAAGISTVSYCGFESSIGLSAAPYLGTGNINSISASSFVTAIVPYQATNNYQLSSGSSAYNSGTVVANCTTDLLGAVRPQMSQYDIGAYEYVPAEAACFTAFKNNPATAALPDYSYAGYKLGSDSIPNVNLPVFDVTKYGALPDDVLEDFDGVQAAVNAAVAAGGGVVYFPKGKFLMNEQVGRTVGISIPIGNIILRGSGSGVGGTELFINNHFVPTDISCKYCTPPLFYFYYYQGRPVRTQLALDAKRGDKQITVLNASTFSVGNIIDLNMTNPVATNELLAGLTPYPEWTTTINTGININEKHKIAAISGNVITLVEPININMTASYTWDVRYRPLTQGLGVEDLWFHGNFHEIFVHHKDYIHDSGWSGIGLDYAENPFIRRLRFTDMNVGVLLWECYASSVLFLRFDGNPGHFMVENNGGDYGTLLGYIDDAADYPGEFHGPGPSASASATVLWRYRGGARSGPESHASYPYYTLVDASNCKYIGNGGDAVVCPNHGKDFTYWNTKEIGSTSNIAFWENHLNPPYGNFPKIVYPNVVGWQGASTFDTTTIGIYESYGKPVSPESLYEAQLALRLGSLPAWINSAKRVWANYLLTGQWPTNSYTSGALTLVNDTKYNAALVPIDGGFNLSVNSLNARFEVYSVAGELIKSGLMLDYSQNILMTGCNHGVYLIIVKVNGERITKKLVY